MLSKLFFLNPLKERKKPRDATDELALVKAAAWAWYQHGSGSEGKAMSEFDARRTRRAPRPSRYKLEAIRMEKEAKEDHGPSIHTKKPLLDTYEIQSISRQLDRLIIESGGHNNKVGNSNNNSTLDNSGRNMKKKKRISTKGFFWPRHAVVCGRRDDVVDHGTALRGDRLSAKHVAVVKLAKGLLKAN